MRLRYVFSETGTGLRRNVSMTVALVVTMFVSLTLVGMGLLLNTQADKAEQRWGSRLQITVYMCNDISKSANCAGGEVTGAQRSTIEDTLKTHPEVRSTDYRSKKTEYAALQELAKSQDSSRQDLYSAVKVEDMNTAYRVTLKDPQKYQGVEGAVRGLQGVDSVQDLHQILSPIYAFLSAMKWGAIGIAVFLLIAAVLEIGNTIRLTAFARRREIGIMRLVGASSLYIQLPFLMETLVAALVGVALSGVAIALFTYLVVYRLLRENSEVVAWIGWADAGQAIGLIAVLGIVLTLIPTLVLTRKYLKV
ncbi:cell division protein FtsX [Marmoricola endophyticus]|uniref:Cell division protein FtsX n=1 Tax=Marmoricola endophyticus TaxID=2040280 RepID=A0A917BSK5_9ACTN|nr:permease-like cell division protein FtsX [Marmoricola endophyticus]GGF57180.1 cell division protein FtsX [Marmoricola endophyticus]